MEQPLARVRNGRALGDIEKGLASAEAAYADADKRLKAAEQDRASALEEINKQQQLFDEAVADLRSRSTPGSRWCGSDGDDNVLDLQPSDISETLAADDRRVVRPAQFSSVAREFERLRSVADAVGTNDGGEK